MSNRRKAPYPLVKVTINLREGDPDFINEHIPELGYSHVIRRIVAEYVDKIKAAKAAAGLEETPAA